MDIKYMERAIDLAKKGIGYTSPNPLVGAVIVKNGKIIGEGYHKIYGGPHAEINAFNNATEDVTGATMYVTLEPCSHYGKTPPCAKAITEKGISKVIIGMKDPNPIVAGSGIKILEDNGRSNVVAIIVFDSESRFNSFESRGVFPWVSTITLTGSFPFLSSSLVVSIGSSAKTVPIPTIIADNLCLISCVNFLEASFVTHLESPVVVAIFPSNVMAVFIMQKVLEGIKLGDSISTNGVCLTVIAFGNNSFTIDVMPETMRR